MSDWYFVRDGERRGPVSFDVLRSEIQSGILEADALVWTDGMEDWVAAGTVPALKSPGDATPGQMPSSPPDPFEPGRAIGPGEFGLVSYAGFWKRFAAYLIDYIITLAIGLATGFAAAILQAATSDSLSATIGALNVLFSSLLGLAYFAGMESSSTQATIGKMAIGIKVTDLDGNRISLGRAIGRNVAKILSALILMMGYIMAGFTERKQALHDMIAGTLVVNK